MKNGRLTTLSVLLGVCFVIYLTEFFSGAKDGWNDAAREIDETSGIEPHKVEVNLKSVVDYAFPDTLQMISDKKIPYQISTLIMKLEDPGAYEIVSRAIALVMAPVILGLLIWGAISFVRFIHDVQRQRIFISQNVRRLRVISWLLFVFVIMQNLTAMLDYYFLLIGNNVSVPGYAIADFHFQYEAFFVGLFFALFAEIFAMGVKMKEEQDLTV